MSTETNCLFWATLHINNKKLSYRRETVQRFMSLNILLSHSRSLSVIPDDTAE